MKAYWFCREDMTSPNAPRTVWKIGQKRTLRGGEIIPCQRGFHGSPTLWDALKYAPGPMACLVELDGDVTPHGDPIDKYAARSRTLLAAVNIERELRLFAADCAEHVLWIYERDFPNDSRPRDAIQAARDYASASSAAAAKAASYASSAYAASSAAAYAAASAYAAYDASAAYAAAYAAYAAYDASAASDAAYAAASAAASYAAASYATYAAYASSAAASYATYAAAEKAWQREQFEQRFSHLFAEHAE